MLALSSTGAGDWPSFCLAKTSREKLDCVRGHAHRWSGRPNSEDDEEEKAMTRMRLLSLCAPVCPAAMSRGTRGPVLCGPVPDTPFPSQLQWTRCMPSQREISFFDTGLVRVEDTAGEWRTFLKSVPSVGSCEISARWRAEN